MEEVQAKGEWRRSDTVAKYYNRWRRRKDIASESLSRRALATRQPVVVEPSPSSPSRVVADDDVISLNSMDSDELFEFDDDFWDTSTR